jgi:cyanophycinase
VSCRLIATSGKFLIAFLSFAAQIPGFQYYRIGTAQNVTRKTSAGYALMGGGSDLDDAFRFLCEKGGGGDFLVLQAAGTDDYNDYINRLCKTNSVATLIIPDRQTAGDPKVAKIIRDAEAIFIAGGDQARYINWWQGTPVERALNAHIAAGKPIGGTSAGLAVMGEYIYSAQGDAPEDEDLKSAPALMNPFMPRVTVRRNFLKIDLLHNTLTDTHFAERDRMGRTLTFLARIVQDGWSKKPREIAVDGKSALLVERDGESRVIGPGKGAYFLLLQEPPQVCRENRPLSLRHIAVYHAPSGADFNLKDWRGKGDIGYSLSVVEGSIQSTRPGGKTY